MRFLLALCCAAMLPAFCGQEKTAESGAGFYQFVNNTGGKFSDAQISWTLDGGKTFKTLADAKEAPAKMGGGGRLYIKLEANGETYKDFIEFTHGGAGWFGNTTLVDEFVIPLTIELFNADGKSRKVGIVEPRSALFAAFKKEAPAEFQDCVKGTQRIVSPCRATFDKGKTNGKYFDKYIDEVWDKFATEAKTPGGWTGKVVNGALIFTDPSGKTSKGTTCSRKPTTQEAFLGSGVLGGLPQICAAINRHVLAEPENWNNPAKFYPEAPANFYAKFWHAHSIDSKAYGFCYDDVAQQDTLVHFPKPIKLVITIGWDGATGAK
ncbi:MAG TPA: beta-1,3-glucanase family protein [Planctomycetota bacterium]|nr:beta-1,3-glucanase family protein [Planctomycetota bacterium]